MRRFHPVPMSWVKRKYDRLRERYFLSPEGIIPPTSAELTWSWTVERGTLGMTLWDEDDDAYAVELDPRLRGMRRVLISTLMHELSHIRLGPDVICPPWAGHQGSAAWRAEVARLATAGAMLE